MLHKYTEESIEDDLYLQIKFLKCLISKVLNKDNAKILKTVKLICEKII